MTTPTWDIFCRVIDNHGDVGVCWRLAADLASRGVEVRLWIDDASALAWMAPGGADGVTVLAWPDGAGGHVPGDVVVEAFGCDLPEAFLARMKDRPRPPVWIDLEYLSAESYVERSHGLASPQTTGPGAGLMRWFFYPGFSAGTGGLLREAGLIARRDAFDRPAWLARHGVEAFPGERIVSVFCYEQAAFESMMNALADEPTLVLLTPGHAARQGARWVTPTRRRGDLRAVELPLLTQTDYDHLLWSCDLNFVRGEDSFVRAQWAGAPFVWQIYPQDDGAHRVKLEAFLARHLAGAEAGSVASIGALWRAWNGVAPPARIVIPALAQWRAACLHWRESLLVQQDLSTRLLDFVREKG